MLEAFHLGGRPIPHHQAAVPSGTRLDRGGPIRDPQAQTSQVLLAKVFPRVQRCRAATQSRLSLSLLLGIAVWAL